MANRKELQIGNFVITADSYQWILSKEKISEGSRNPNKKSNIGSTIRSVVGYYGTLNSLLERLVDEHMKDSLIDVDELNQLYTTSINDIVDDVAKLTENINPINDDIS